MSDNPNTYVSSVVVPWLPIIGGAVRGTLQIAMGFGFAWSTTVTGDQATMITMGLGMFATMGWSLWQKVAAKIAARKAEVLSAEASAKVGLPVTLTVTPVGEPNLLTPIPSAELGKA